MRLCANLLIDFFFFFCLTPLFRNKNGRSFLRPVIPMTSVWTDVFKELCQPGNNRIISINGQIHAHHWTTKNVDRMSSLKRTKQITVLQPNSKSLTDQLTQKQKKILENASNKASPFYATGSISDYSTSYPDFDLNFQIKFPQETRTYNAETPRCLQISVLLLKSWRL